MWSVNGRPWWSPVTKYLQSSSADIITIISNCVCLENVQILIIWVNIQLPWISQISFIYMVSRIHNNWFHWTATDLHIEINYLPKSTPFIKIRKSSKQVYYCLNLQKHIVIGLTFLLSTYISNFYIKNIIISHFEKYSYLSPFQYSALSKVTI